MNSREVLSNTQFDVVIIGSGGSGLPAAVTAAEAGASVLVIDKRKIVGGTARLPGGVFAVDSPAQRRQGIHHPTADEYFRTHMDYSNWLCEARLTREWINGTSDIIRWLEAKGLEFTVDLNLSGPMRILHRVVGQTVNTGNAIVNALVAEAKQRGVQFLTETTALRVLQDANENVSGLVVRRGDGELTISAKCVMIATGTMTHNKEIQKQYFPHVDFASFPIMQLPFSTGDGYFLAKAAGGAEDGHVAPLWIGPCNHPYNTRIGNIVRRPYGLIVNKYGMRYCDESLWSLKDFGWWTGVALDLQPDKMCYCLIDDKNLKSMMRDKEILNGMEEIYGRIVATTIGEIKEATERQSGIVADEEADPTAWLAELDQDVQSEADAGRIKIANSIEEIAEWMGADLGVLKEEVARYNKNCSQGYDADFLKDRQWMRPLREPPFYAMRANQGLDMIGGGIRVSHKMEVLNRQLRPIGGLYAGGLACSGWFGVAGEATGSCCISFSLYSGYVAGKQAAAYAQAVDGVS